MKKEIDIIFDLYEIYYLAHLVNDIGIVPATGSDFLAAVAEVHSGGVSDRVADTGFCDGDYCCDFCSFARIRLRKKTKRSRMRNLSGE